MPFVLALGIFASSQTPLYLCFLQMCVGYLAIWVSNLGVSYILKSLNDSKEQLQLGRRFLFVFYCSYMDRQYCIDELINLSNR